MLKELFLKNFVLTENCQISFAKGFNVLSGETGSGKTMVTEALSLILGQKADTSFIRKGEQSAHIKALFELSNDSPIYTILNEAGIEIEKGEDILISRELSLSLKNRIFIHSQIASLPLLKAIRPYLIETISQHSQLLLKEEENQKKILDDFADLSELKKTYKTAYLEEKESQTSLNELKQKLHDGKLQQHFWKESLEEILLAKIQEGEEEHLFEEYKRLINFQEIQTLTNSLLVDLSEGNHSILSRIAKAQKDLGKILYLDNKLSSLESILSSCYEQLSDASFSLNSYMSHLEGEPKKLEEIQNRLTFLKVIKKKYGPTFADILIFKQKLEEKLRELDKIEFSIEDLSVKLSEATLEKEKLALALSNQRLLYGEKLSLTIEKHLHMLNMDGAKFDIRIETTSFNPSGSDLVSFWLAANGGKNFAPINEHASGGELSRILFALKLILADKDQCKTLIFDEIDANIGGVTASIFGKELKNLGFSRQIICITHFPQVASFADHHMRILKTPTQEGVFTEVKVLSEGEKKEEILRMLGGLSLLSSES